MLPYKKIFKYKSEIYAILGYLILTIIMTHPLIFNFGSFAGSNPDIYQVAWGFWWMKTSLLDLKTYPLYTHHIFYPSGVSLLFFTLTPLNSLFSVPLQLAFGLVTSYNIIFIFSFVISGFGTYLLVKYLTKNKIAAFISGIAFAFSPFRFTAALAHMQLLSTGWIPLFVLFLIKTVKEKKISNAVLAGVFLMFTALSSWYYVLYMIIFIIYFLLHTFLPNKKPMLNKQFIKRFLIMGLVFLVSSSPVILPMITEALSSGYMRKPLDPAIVTSADLLAFFTPGEAHPIFGSYLKETYQAFSYNEFERVVFVGYTVLFFSIYAVLKLRKKETRFWLISFLIFFILSLGPVLHIFGRFLFPSPFKLGSLAKILGIQTSELGYELLDNFFGIPLPYVFLHLFFPFFSIMRSPSRFSVISMLSLSVLLGYGISLILKKPKFNKTIPLAISLLILFEFLVVPFPTLDPSIPKFYEKMAKEPDDYAIVEAPISFTHYMYYQTFHGKKIVGGIFGRRPPYTREFVDTTPILRELKRPIPGEKVTHNNFLRNVMQQNPDAAPIIQKYIEAEEDIYSYSQSIDYQEEPSEKDVEILSQYGIRYIILHKNFLDDESFDRMNNMLRTFLNESIYDDGDTIVYEIKNK